LHRAGAQHSVYTCESCRTEHFAGLTVPEKCHSCGEVSVFFTRRIRDEEPISGLCALCRDELTHAKELFDAGGVLFRCTDCGVRGQLPADHPKAKLMRARIPAPGFAGVTLTKSHGCPKCEKKT
jgi:rubrerythrin